jgi:uncharacterized protein YjaZ
MKNIYSRYCLFLLMVIGTLITSACTQNERNIGVLSEHPETGQAYEILNVSLLYEDFMRQAESITPEEINELYQAEIIAPVYEACFEDGEFLHEDYELPMLTEAPSDLAKIQEVIDRMDFEHMSSLMQEALIKSSDHLPSENKTTVCVFPAVKTDDTALMFVPGTGKIIVLYSEAFYRDDMLKAGMAHEYHHTLWSERTAHIENRAPLTVLDSLIFEGKAVMFEKLLYPDSKMISINNTYNKSFWNEIEPDLHKVDPDRAQEIISGGRGGVPSFYGYSEGYKMVEAYLELHPDLTPAEWYDVDAKVIYEEGDYISNYE